MVFTNEIPATWSFFATKSGTFFSKSAAISLELSMYGINPQVGASIPVGQWDVSCKKSKINFFVSWGQIRWWLLNYYSFKEFQFMLGLPTVSNMNSEHLSNLQLQVPLDDSWCWKIRFTFISKKSYLIVYGVIL